MMWATYRGIYRGRLSRDDVKSLSSLYKTYSYSHSERVNEVGEWARIIEYMDNGEALHTEVFGKVSNKIAGKIKGEESSRLEEFVSKVTPFLWNLYNTSKSIAQVIIPFINEEIKIRSEELWAEYSDPNKIKDCFTDLGPEVVWRSLRPVGSFIVLPAIGVNFPAVIPIEARHTPTHIIYNSLERIVAGMSLIASLAMYCVVCPIGQTGIRLILPTAYTAHLARINLPPLCSPISWWLTSYSIVTFGISLATLKVTLNVVLPIKNVVRTVSSLVTGILQAIIGGQNSIVELCRGFGDMAKRVIAPCLSAAYFDIILASALISSCLSKCVEQIKEGLEMAEEIENYDVNNAYVSEMVWE